ncbi:MAG TPA: DUF4245 family protein [Nocardioides sp.]|uniref:DUF4245 family protein n=1 Tax=Nocardioides sp. TaxID=35761 RepID=UPI002E3109FF|nr:DUF4245 family protein [Nocardioides sp.]HEX5089834.1 DUF4245 family protein [Nocardioides sp.]
MSEPRERPSRYDRSFGGLIAALIATVLFVTAYVGFRAFIREQPDVEPESVNYLSCVSDVQGAGSTVVYPIALPAGWLDTSVAYERGESPSWRIGILTDREQFVGVVQQDEDAEDLVRTYVDKNAIPGDDASPANGLGATTWRTWSDRGGDHAFATVLDSGPLAGETLLVYGSASVAEQEALIDLLTVAPVPDQPADAECAAS